MTSAAEDQPAPSVNDYDRLAEAYSAENEDGIANAYYERPAILTLAGEVTGRRILDAGCGSGPLFAALRERGAVVSGVDSSAGMLELARRRLGDDADLRVADLREPLPFPDGAFDDVVASLVLPRGRHQRAAARTGRPRTVPRRVPRPVPRPELPVLRAGRRLTAAPRAHAR